MKNLPVHLRELAFEAGSPRTVKTMVDGGLSVMYE
jgi:hypothetical protein